MLSRKSKALYYLLASPFMTLNGLLYRFLRVPKREKLYVHLGPGQNNYIDGWINIDANMFTAKCDLWADLRNPLPFKDNTVDAIYSHHVVEHLPDINNHFCEVFRCLKPGGIYRVGCPNGDSAVRKFIENDFGWFGDFPDKRVSIGGRFENFLLCRGEHLSIITYTYIDEIMLNAGFSDIKIYKPAKETGYMDLFKKCLEKEHESDYLCPHTLIVEGVKRMSR